MDLTQYEQHRTSPALVGVLLFVVGLAGGYGISQKLLRDRDGLIEKCQISNSRSISDVSDDITLKGMEDESVPPRTYFGKASEVTKDSFVIEFMDSSVVKNTYKSSIGISSETKFANAVRKDIVAYEKEMKDYTDKAMKLSNSQDGDSSLGNPPTAFSETPADSSYLKNGASVLVEVKATTTSGEIIKAAKVVIIPTTN